MRVLFLGGPWGGSLKDIPETDYWKVPVPGGDRDHFMYEMGKVSMFGRWGPVMFPAGASQKEKDALALEAMVTEKGKETLPWQV